MMRHRVLWKAFCAGGDLQTLFKQHVGTSEPMEGDFTRIQYRLVYQLALIEKPYVAVLDGYTMGGGCGLSMNGSFRISTERCVTLAKLLILSV